MLSRPFSDCLSITWRYVCLALSEGQHLRLALSLVPPTTGKSGHTWTPGLRPRRAALRVLPKSQRKVLEGALIFPTLWPELAFACEHFPDLVDMQ